MKKKFMCLDCGKNEPCIITARCESGVDALPMFCSFTGVVANWEAIKTHGMTPREYANQLGPQWNYIAMDDDGSWWKYRSKPRMEESQWMAQGYDLGKKIKTRKIIRSGDWKNSLVKKEEVNE